MIKAFVENPRNFDEIKTMDVFKLYQELENVGSYQKLSKEFKNIVKNLWDDLWNPDLYKHGIHKIGGWEFNFRGWMRKFWVDESDYGISEYYAFNKTLIRENSTNPSYIIKIVEVE